MTNLLVPLDKLAERLEKTEKFVLELNNNQLETNKLLLSELRDMWKQIHHMHKCLAEVEVRLGLKPTLGPVGGDELSGTVAKRPD